MLTQAAMLCSSHPALRMNDNSLQKLVTIVTSLERSGEKGVIFVMPAYMFTLSENLVKIGRGHVHSEIIGFQGSSEKK